MLDWNADACITTQKSIDLSGHKDSLEQVHNFGKPNMVFTIWTPLSKTEINNFITNK
jgi:hypothetical protein